MMKRLLIPYALLVPVPTEVLAVAPDCYRIIDYYTTVSKQ